MGQITRQNLKVPVTAPLRTTAQGLYGSKQASRGYKEQCGGACERENHLVEKLPNWMCYLLPLRNFKLQTIVTEVGKTWRA